MTASGNLVSKVVKTVPGVHQTLGYPRDVFAKIGPPEPDEPGVQEVLIERTSAGRALRPALSRKGLRADHRTNSADAERFFCQDSSPAGRVCADLQSA